MVDCSGNQMEVIMSTNLFEAVSPARKAGLKTGKKDTKKRVEIKTLERYATVDSLVKSLTTVQKTMKPVLDAQTLEELMTEGTRLGRTPENFRGFEGKAEASMELRKRSSASALSETDVELLAGHNVSTQVVEDMPDTYIINPTYRDDKVLLSRVSAA